MGPDGNPGILYIPYPYTRPSSPLLKLPNITKDAYWWDGDTSTLKSKIRVWERDFGKHSPNIVVPWIRCLIPDDHQWRLDKANDFQDCVDALLDVVSDEDVYIKKIEAEIRSHPRCTSLLEDKHYLIFLSRKIAKLIDIEQHYVISPSQCTDFFSF